MSRPTEGRASPVPVPSDHILLSVVSIRQLVERATFPPLLSPPPLHFYTLTPWPAWPSGT